MYTLLLLPFHTCKLYGPVLNSNMTVLCSSKIKLMLIKKIRQVLNVNIENNMGERGENEMGNYGILMYRAVN